MPKKKTLNTAKHFSLLGSNCKKKYWKERDKKRLFVAPEGQRVCGTIYMEEKKHGK